MIEIKLSKIPKWSEVEDIIKLRQKDLVLFKLPKSVFEHPKMRYKLEYLKKKGIFVEVENAKRGRKRKVNDETLKTILELLKEGYSVREVGRILGIPKSTIWDYTKEYIKELKVERLKKLIWEYKEYLINKGKYSPTLQVLFAELEATVDYDLEKAKKILEEIIKHAKQF